MTDAQWELVEPLLPAPGWLAGRDGRRAKHVKAVENVDADTRGFYAGKKINGRKRHIAVDTVGLFICVLVTGARYKTAPPPVTCWPV